MGSAPRPDLMMHCYAALGLQLSNSIQAVIYAYPKYYLKQDEFHLSRYR